MLVPTQARRQFIRRLDRFVSEVCSSPVFRRKLRYHPQDALAAHALDGALSPAQLPVRHHQVDVLLNTAQLFGLTAPLLSVPPFAARLITYGVKPVALIHGPEEDLVSVLSWAERHGYTAFLSSDEWQPLSDEGKGGYCNRMGEKRRARAGSGAGRTLVVAQDEDHGLLVWLCLLFGWDEFLGRLLGYPSCCATAFRDRWQTAVEKHQGDLTIPSLLASGLPPYDWRINIFGRYFGYELIQHFPCRFDCKPTLDIAVAYAGAVQRYEPDMLVGIQAQLCAPVLYTERYGVALFVGANVQRSKDRYTVEYDSAACLFTLPQGPLSSAVRAAHVLTFYPETHTVRVGVQDSPAYFACFAETGSAGTPHPEERANRYAILERPNHRGV